MDARDNVAHFPEPVSLEASRWIAKLDRGDLSEQERSELSDWVSKSPKHRIALATQLKEWSDMDLLSELVRLDLNQSVSGSGSWLRRLWDFKRPIYPNLGWALAMPTAVIAIAAVLLVAGIVPLDSREGTYDSVTMGIDTQIGEQKTENLPDGSVVHINTRSSADISYTQDERSVVLHDGEAFFEVAHDSERPFVVYVDDTAVKAVGTAFAVQKANGIISVSVTEGTVDLTSQGITTRIAANEAEGSSFGNVATRANNETRVETQPSDVLARRLDWQDGMLEFRGESLQQAIKELARYTDAQIVIIDEDIQDVRLGGYFKVGDIEGLTSTLALGFDIQVDVISNDLIHLSRTSEN